MQLSVRSAGFLIVIYLLVLAVVGWYLGKDYREASRLVLSDTADLVLRQVNTGLKQAGQSRVLAREPGALELFRKFINTIDKKSDTITGLAVFDRFGNLLAGHTRENFPLDFRKTDPDQQTGTTNKSHTGLSAGKYSSLIPLRQEDQLIAHVSIELDNKTIGEFYEVLTRRYLYLALGGTLILLLFGIFLYRELRGINNDLVKLMQSGLSSPGKRKFVADEFRNARSQALKTGSENLQHYDTFSTLSQATRLGLALFSKDGSEVFVSDSVREILDLYYNKTLADGFGNDNWQTVQNTMDVLVASPHRSTVIELEVDSGDTRKELEIELYRTRESGGHILALIRDHDYVTALQSSLRAATRMHTLSSIYLGAAHDLRAPISAMVLTLELLEDSQVDSPHSGHARIRQREQRRYIRILKEELNRLQRFLTSFLDNATTVRQSGWQSVNLVSIVLELLRLFHSRAQQSRVEIRTDIEDTNIFIMANGDQIRQMLMNIIVNALEVMPNGGVLAVSIHRHTATAVIRIRDTGPGMSLSVLNRVFDMHFTTKDTGTGIGLYVAQSVVQQHGGNIKANNSLEQGTEFVITLPLGPDQSQ